MSSRETKVIPKKNDCPSENKEQEKKLSTKTSNAQDTVVSHLNATGKSSKCSMIVGVSHCDKP